MAKMMQPGQFASTEVDVIEILKLRNERTERLLLDIFFSKQFQIGH